MTTDDKLVDTVMELIVGDDGALPNTIDLTPNWQELFRYAVAIVRAEIPVENGQALVVEMLEFGARLEDVHRKAPSS